jgi:hypothetical protein
MRERVKMAAAEKSGSMRLQADATMPPYFSIPELASRWRCSRGTVYNVIRGEKVLDFATPGHRGKKLVPRDVVCSIEQSNTRVWR